MRMAERGLVRELPRQPGQHDPRWVHLLGDGARRPVPVAAAPAVDRESVLAGGAEAPGRAGPRRRTTPSPRRTPTTSSTSCVDGQPFETWLLDRVAAHADGGPVVEVGCGPGHVTAYLADAGADATGIDLSPADGRRGPAPVPRRHLRGRRPAPADAARPRPPGWSAVLGVVLPDPPRRLRAAGRRRRAGPSARARRLAGARRCTRDPRCCTPTSGSSADIDLDFVLHEPEDVVAVRRGRGSGRRRVVPPQPARAPRRDHPAAVRRRRGRGPDRDGGRGQPAPVPPGHRPRRVVVRAGQRPGRAAGGLAEGHGADEGRRHGRSARHGAASSTATARPPSAVPSRSTTRTSTSPRTPARLRGELDSPAGRVAWDLSFTRRSGPLGAPMSLFPSPRLVDATLPRNKLLTPFPVADFCRRADLGRRRRGTSTAGSACRATTGARRTRPSTPGASASSPSQDAVLEGASGRIELGRRTLAAVLDAGRTPRRPRVPLRPDPRPLAAAAGAGLPALDARHARPRRARPAGDDRVRRTRWSASATTTRRAPRSYCLNSKTARVRLDAGAGRRAARSR